MGGDDFDLEMKFMLFSKFPSFLVIITWELAPPPALSETNPARVPHKRYNSLSSPLSSLQSPAISPCP